MADTPAERYQRDSERPDFQPDQAQRVAVEHLQRLYEQLVAAEPRWYRNDWLPRVWPFSKKGVAPVQGVYLWGGVGRGKTYLMDMFYETLPFERKMRTHFHRFMRRVHADLTRLKGQKNPLDKVAEQLAREARVLCFDEFFVSDIADAMVLANLLTALFERGVTLVATSNIMPDGLYRHGLQRERFMPAIELLNRHTDVVNVDGGPDYRLRTLSDAKLYHYPLGEVADQALMACFKSLMPGSGEVRKNVSLEIEGRNIPARYEADDVVWFDFSSLCDGPRSQHDYIVLAKEYHAVILSGVPALDDRCDDQARRFVYLVDEFYDRRVKLVLSASKPIVALYGDGALSFEFARTTSRLLEMQSDDYLALPHRP